MTTLAVMWTSCIFCPSGKLSTDGVVPDGSMALFREKIAPLLAEGGQVDTTVADAALIDLVGCLVHDLVSVKEFISFVTVVEIANSENAKESLTDAVWFWGTQVLQTFTLYNELLTPLTS